MNSIADSQPEGRRETQRDSSQEPFFRCAPDSESFDKGVKLIDSRRLKNINPDLGAATLEIKSDLARRF